MKNTVLSLLWALSNRGARVVVARGIVCALLLLTGGAALGIRGQSDRPPGEDLRRRLRQRLYRRRKRHHSNTLVVSQMQSDVEDSLY